MVAGNSAVKTKVDLYFKGTLLCVFFFVLPALFVSSASAFSNINNTKHNLSVSGPGPYKAITETRICVFCHTPHNATPATPLWNHQEESQNYVVYTGDAGSPPPVYPDQPFGYTKLCLSCHDGTVALGAVVSPSATIATTAGGPLPSSSLANFGTNLSSHHPVSFSYSQAQKADTTGQLEDPALLPPSLELGGSGIVQCTTCHDAHDDTYGNFLVMDNRYSAMCTSCHKMTGWNGSGHATNPFLVSGILPRLPKTSPSWTRMNEWGCEVCHTPHLAATPAKLLNFCSDPPPAPYIASFSCTTGGCHASASPPYHDASLSVSSASSARYSSGTAGMADIGGQIKKKSGHREQPGAGVLVLHNGQKGSFSSLGGVSCVDCHNPHAANREKASAPPDASGMLRGVAGVDSDGMAISSVRYEYEICFKCHGDYTSDFPTVPRVVNTVNKREAFARTNQSYHPVVEMGTNHNVPSIPSSAEPGLLASSMIYCTDCHRDDAGSSKGPHGSAFAPILRERYETADNTPESYENYSLCYRCHSRESILSDRSFQRKIAGTTPLGGAHSGHLANRAPCSACHDAHGVPDDNGTTGDHTHLINFDTRIVSPAPGYTFPIFKDLGTFSGSCTLICHGRVHLDETYPLQSPGSIDPLMKSSSGTRFRGMTLPNIRRR
jgi:predicted CXXCH cytochrome family protein